MACMERGKHVYVQKPLTHTIWEARQLTGAAAKYKVATQMGNQGYSNEGTRQCAEMIWAGEIGNVTEVHAWTDRPIWPQGLTEIPPPTPVPATLDWDLWLGIAETRPYTAGGERYPNNYGGYFYQPFNWRGFYDFGCGALGDMACHILGAPNLALQTGRADQRGVHQEGRHQQLHVPEESTIRFDFPARGSMPPVKLFWHDGLKETPKIRGRAGRRAAGRSPVGRAASAVDAARAADRASRPAQRPPASAAQRLRRPGLQLRRVSRR